MKILIVCSSKRNRISPFVVDQVLALNSLGITTEYFLIEGKGVLGYLKSFPGLLNHIRRYNPDIIHAHYGLSGLLANLQRNVPVVTTFHGSDINNKRVHFFSELTHSLSASSIFVTKDLFRKVKARNNSFVIPCGVDFLVFKKTVGGSPSIKNQIVPNFYNILFASAFNNQVKNATLALEACNSAGEELDKKTNLIELKGFNREEVSQLMNFVDCTILTSFSEGSPQFIKEAMACNCPIISTNVGDVEWVIGETEGCYLTTFETKDVAEKIKLALKFSKEKGRTNGRERILALGLDSETVAKRIVEVYHIVLKDQINS